MECGDFIAKFLGHIEDDGHFVGAIAVVVNFDVAIQNTRQRFHAQIAGEIFAAVALFPIFLRFDPCLAIDRQITHARGGHPPFTAINTLWVFAACHFQAVWRAGKLHPLHCARIDVFKDYGTPAHQVCGTRKNLQRRYAAIGKRAAEPRVLWPDAVFGPYFWCGWRCRFVAIAVRLNRWCRIIAQM